MIDLDEFKGALELALKELDKDLGAYRSMGLKDVVQDEDKVKAFYRVGNFLQWCNAIIDRCKKTFPVNQDELLLAVRAANNAIKHNIAIIELRKFDHGGVAFPMSYPLTIPAPLWRWGELAPCGSLQYKDQEDAYNKILKGRDICVSCEEIYKLLSEILATIKLEKPRNE